MARDRAARARQDLGRGHRGRAAPTSRSATASSSRSSGRRAAASRRRCSCSPASTRRAAGEILFDGARVNEVEARDRNVGIVFQSYALYPHMTVRRQHPLPAALQGRRRGRGATAGPRRGAAGAGRGAARAPAGPDVGRPAAARGAGPRAGQGAAAAAARRAALQPRRLAAAHHARRDPRLQRQLGVTTILVTHDQIEATTMADRIICMSKGRIEQIGTADDLYQRPDSLFVAGFIGSPPINLLPGSGRARRARGSSARACLCRRGARARWCSASGRRRCASASERRARRGSTTSSRRAARRSTGLTAALGPLRALEAGRRCATAIGDRWRSPFDAGRLLVFDGERAADRGRALAIAA